LITDSQDGAYELAFYLAGAGITLAGLLLLIVPLLRHCEVIMGSEAGARGGRHSEEKVDDFDEDEEQAPTPDDGEFHVRFNDSVASSDRAGSDD